MRLSCAAAMVGLAILAGCSGGRAAKPDPEDLKKADLAFARAAAERGLEGFSSFLDPDVMTIRPNTPVLKGRKELADRWVPLLTNASTSIAWQPLEAVISEGGDFGFTIGSYEVTRTAGGSKAVSGSGKYITIWKRQPGGEWKVVFDSGVQDASRSKPAQ